MMKECFLMLFVLLAAGLASAAEAPAPASLPEGPGLSAKYPGDLGIEKDPAVIIAENFEEKDLEELAAAPSRLTVTGKRWTDVAGAKGDDKTLSLVTESANVHSGKQALGILVNEASRESGNLFARLKPGYDQLYGRFYIRFAENYPYESHTGLELDALNVEFPWPTGGAGVVPTGDQRFGGMLEPEPGDGKTPPGFWSFYIYWHEMKGNYGNIFQSDPLTPVVRGQWICCELMFKANSKPEARDGECAYWIDGKLRYHGTGFNWRTAEALKLNSVHLHHYMNKQGRAWGADKSPRQQWFDDVVIATQYIGPQVKATEAQPAPQPASKPAP